MKFEVYSDTYINLWTRKVWMLARHIYFSRVSTMHWFSTCSNWKYIWVALSDDEWCSFSFGVGVAWLGLSFVDSNWSALERWLRANLGEEKEEPREVVSWNKAVVMPYLKISHLFMQFVCSDGTRKATCEHDCSQRARHYFRRSDKTMQHAVRWKRKFSAEGATGAVAARIIGRDK